MCYLYNYAYVEVKQFLSFFYTSSIQIVPNPIGLVNFLVSRDLFKDIIESPDKVNYLYENF